MPKLSTKGVNSPTVKDANQSSSSQREKRTYCTDYPWEVWRKRRRFVLRRGEDFNCQTHSMISTLRSKARDWDMKISVRVVDDGILRVALKDKSHT